ncbi:MAG: hypothetical protein M0Z82_10960, partial [Actinomycetota bacterium]|nr:hypothetical protein [Actinomycetota bacterium]
MTGFATGGTAASTGSGPGTGGTGSGITAASTGSGPGTGGTGSGIDVERVTAWFTAEVPGVVPPLDFELIAGGRSNLTFAVTDASGR